MRITCERCLRRYDVPDAAMSGRKIRARCKCGTRIVIQDRVAEGEAPESAAESKHRPTRWFVDITSWEPIAMDMRQLVRAFAAGRIDADTLIWCKGMPDWRRLRDVEELAERLLGVASGGSPGPGVAPRASKTNRPGAREAASEPPPRRVAGSRSVTPQASYVVASAGDTMPLTKPGEQESSGPSPALAAEAAEARADEDEKADTTSAPPVSFSEDASSEAAAIEGAGADAAAIVAAGVEVAAANDTSTPNTSTPNTSTPSTSARFEPEGSVALPQFEAARAIETDTPAAERKESRPDSSKPMAAASDPAGKSAPSQPPLSRANASARADLQAAGAVPLSNRAARQRSAKQGRRRSSSEETPAQKPASLSVAPSAPRRHRGRRIVALAGTLGLIWLIGKATLDRSTQPLSTPVAESAPPKARDDGSAESKGRPVEVSDEPAIVVPPADKGPSDDSRAHDGPTDRGPSDDSPADNHPADSNPADRAAAPSDDQAAKPESQSMRSLLPPRVGVPLVAAPQALNTKPVLRRPEPPKRAPVSAPQRATPPAVAAPRVEVRPNEVSNAANAQPPAVPPPAVPPPAVPPPSVSPSAEPPSAAAPAASKPGPFDLAKAEQQMAIAAWIASTCGQMGETRGTGQVKVLIEPSGRVVRVTQLDPSFVGTPVGHCVTQAYEQVKVPPFDGGTRSLVGSFVIK